MWSTKIHSIGKYFLAQCFELSAKKYMRSLSETALHYKPAQLKTLSRQSNDTDRVVQTFFDSTAHRIIVAEAANRLQTITNSSTPSHSYYQVTLPFSSNEQLRKKMVQFFNQHIRVGRVLELMDYIAADVAYRYCSPPITNCLEKINELPFFTVTASIDEIDFFHPIHAGTDCTFSGYVSYVGRSTMEVQIDVLQNIDGKDRLSCSAKFVMAARDKKTGKSYQVPALDISQQPHHFSIKMELGNKRQKQRKKEASKALEVSPPTYEESSQVHKLLIDLKSQPESSWLPMNQTRQNTTLLMHLQDKNLSGKIFGGYIMRLAYELGWLTAFKFLKGRFPKCTHIDDVQFLSPVEIGTSMDLQAVIGYINEQIIHVVVECRNTKGNGQTKMTNILRISFEYEGQCQKVYPQTIQDMNHFIQSMRRVNKYLAS